MTTREQIRRTIKIDFDLFRQGAMNEETFLNRVADYVLNLAKNDVALEQLRRPHSCEAEAARTRELFAPFEWHGPSPEIRDDFQH